MSDEFVPVRIDPEAKPEPPKRIPVFYIGEREYTALERINAKAALRLLKLSSTQGVEAMAWSTLVEGLGEEAINDLIECEAVSDEQVTEIMTGLTARYLKQIRNMGKAKK